MKYSSQAGSLFRWLYMLCNVLEIEIISNNSFLSFILWKSILLRFSNQVLATFIFKLSVKSLKGLENGAHLFLLCEDLIFNNWRKMIHSQVGCLNLSYQARCQPCLPSLLHLDLGTCKRRCELWFNARPYLRFDYRCNC